MPWRKHIASAHPSAITVWLGAAYVGLITLQGLASAKGMESLVGSTWVNIWAAIVTLAGLSAAACGASIRHGVRLVLIRAEAISLVILALAYIWYEITLIYAYGFRDVAITQALANVVWIGATARVVQIIFEVRRVTKPQAGD